jgi:nicotinamide-nucleotide amidase
VEVLMKPNSLSNDEQTIEHLIKKIAQLLQSQNLMLCTAESCTGGMIAAACTDLAGSSQWFERGHVTYSNEAKTEMLGVDAPLIAQHGAVSAEVAQAMVQGALGNVNAIEASSPARVAVAVTGVAGPTGGTPDKPVGTVWFGFAIRTAPGARATVWTQRQRFAGHRADVRQATVRHALQALITALEALPQATST